MIDPRTVTTNPAMPTPEPAQAPMGMDPRQRIAMAMQMQRGMQPQGTGILGGLNTALGNGLQMYGMRQMQRPATPRPMAMRAPDPVMGEGTGMATDPSAYDYLKPQGY